jgi:3,4-dihydroxy 2-butanone 4-phosphate synthase/GTP cyclohydrolase II
MSAIILTPFEEVLARYARGEMLIMVDDADRENEGDFVVATEAATIEHVNLMMQQGRGLLCVSIPQSVAERLNLPLQTVVNNSLFHTAFTVSVDRSCSEGLGATSKERLACMQKLLDDNATPDDFIVPGNVFPLIANEAGTLGRIGQTEGSSDLARLAGFKCSSLLCEILNPDGTMARGKALADFAIKHGYAVTSVAEVKKYRLDKEVHVRLLREFNFATEWGQSQASVFYDDAEAKEHLVLIFGDLKSSKNSKAPLLRLHSECLTGDVFGSRRCDCGPQLSESLDAINKEGSGILIYLRQEGRGIGLSNKLKAYELQDSGLDTVEANEALGFKADQRHYRVAVRILEHFGIKQVRLITNNPKKVRGLEELGVSVVERCGVVIPADQFNAKYLSVKREKLGHLI